MDIVVAVYRVTEVFPAQEKFGVTAQLKRAAIAIPSNIAEGHCRLGAGEFRRFASIARGSGGEVQTQLAVAVALEFIAADELALISLRLDRLSKMLFSVYRSLSDVGRPRPVADPQSPSPVAR